MEALEFVSPTKGRMTFSEAFQHVMEFISQDLDHEYRLIIGTDSLLGDDTTFVTAIIVHRIGKGGCYFYKKTKSRKIESLRQRIFLETSLSLELAAKLASQLAEDGRTDLPVEIHLDVGEVGATRTVIREVVGMVTGSGFEAKVKPEGVGASKVADRHTRR